MKYLVQSVNKAQTKRGKTYLRLRLLETGGKSWNGVFWEDKELEAGVLIDALTEESEFAGEVQLTVKAMRTLDEKPSDLFLPRTSANVDRLFTELLGFIADVKDDNLRGLLNKATEDPRWKRAPAAMLIHHAYLGGLLEHVVGLCRLSHAVAALYPIIRLDLLVTAAVLHDIGKLDELDCDVNISYTVDGELLGHIVIGLLRVDAWMGENQPPFPPELRRVVRHLVISHHGSQAYGSPKSPQILEATVFSNLDGVDANLGAMAAAISKAGPGKLWADKAGFGKDRLYLGPVEGRKA